MPITTLEELANSEDKSLQNAAKLITLKEAAEAIEKQQAEFLARIFAYAEEHKLDLKDLAAEQGIDCFRGDAVKMQEFLEIVDPVTDKPFKDFSLEELNKKPTPLVLRAIRPSFYVSPNTIVSNSLKELAESGEKTKLSASKKYNVYATVTIDPNQYAVNGKLTKYDRRVFNGICSLWESGNSAFTPEMIYRAMNGLQNSESVSPQSCAAITKSIRKLRKIDIEIDATEEFRKRKIINEDETISLFDYCIDISGCVFKKNSTDTFAGFQIGREPVLLTYAKKLNQVVSIPAKVMEVKRTEITNGTLEIMESSPQNSDKFATVREYLAMRIEQMKSELKRKKKYNGTIRIDTFYQETDTNTENRKYTTQARKHAETCLNYWKAIGYIKNYEFTRGKAITGITIYLP